MRVLVNMKKLGKRKNSITKVPYELDNKPLTVKELSIIPDFPFAHYNS